MKTADGPVPILLFVSFILLSDSVSHHIYIYVYTCSIRTWIEYPLTSMYVMLFYFRKISEMFCKADNN